MTTTPIHMYAATQTPQAASTSSAKAATTPSSSSTNSSDAEATFSNSWPFYIYFERRLRIASGYNIGYYGNPTIAGSPTINVSDSKP